jgi:hypothetical protein
LSKHVFISFASKDLKIASAICDALETRGFSCWISSRDVEPGDNFQSAIVSAIRDCKVMLLVFTANSNTSQEMTKELALASQQKIIVVPLRVEDVAPNAAFAYEFATRQWIDLFVDWEKAINQLCVRLERAIPAEDEDEAPPPPPRAAIARAAVPPPTAAPAPAVATPRKSNAGLFIGIGAAVVLVIAAIVAIPMLARKPAAPAASATPAAAVASESASASSAPPAAQPMAPPRTVQPASVAVATGAASAAVRPDSRTATELREARAALEAAKKSARAAPSENTGSDAYVCAHGDADDMRTIRACDRKDIAAANAASQ